MKTIVPVNRLPAISRTALRTAVSVVLALAVLAGCDKASGLEFDDDPPAGTATIAALKSRCTGEQAAVTEDITVEGVVTGNDLYGEFYKTLVVEDTSGGISIAVDATELYVDYPVGTAVTIHCNGLFLCDYGGKVMLGTRPTGEYAGPGRIPPAEAALYLRQKQAETRPLRPRTLTFGEVDMRHTDTYVHFEGVRFVQQGKLVLHSIVRPRWAQLITEEVKYADKMFGGFINGKIMDSAIIGVLCYIGCLIFKFPSALLVSVIIGVTNVIPFFGPFIGAIPATLLILIQSPIKALWFVLFVLVLQQLDGNIIGPKILGNTTGLSSFWVLFAILLFGGLWGFVGMIVGVPLFAVIYDVIKKLVIHGLQRNQELTLLNSYHDQFGDPTDDAAAQPAAPQPAENQ